MKGTGSSRSVGGGIHAIHGSSCGVRHEERIVTTANKEESSNRQRKAFMNQEIEKSLYSKHRMILMKKERTSIQLWFQKGLLLGMGVVLLIVTGLMCLDVAVAETIYSYIDEHGTPVMTDNYNKIPAHIGRK